MELYQRYRPKQLASVIGQGRAVRAIENMLKRRAVPRALLFTGPTGTGKTTMARILAGALGVPEGNVTEINCATCDPLDTVREMELTARTPPLIGPAHVWILNEAQSLSRAGFAQQGLLDPLEHKDGYGYFFFTTTDPGKIFEAVRHRCTEIDLEPISNGDLTGLLSLVANAEKIKLPEPARDAIVRAADGSARSALVLLEKFALGGLEVSKLEAGEGDDQFEIVKAMSLYGGHAAAWPAMAALLEKYKDKSPEGIRQMILASARSALLKRGTPHARSAIDLFRDTYALPGAAGHALLAADMHRFLHGK